MGHAVLAVRDLNPIDEAAYKGLDNVLDEGWRDSKDDGSIPDRHHVLMRNLANAARNYNRALAEVTRALDSRERP